MKWLRWMLLAVLLCLPAMPGLAQPDVLTLHVTVDGQSQTIQSSAPTVLAALWEAGIEVRAADELAPAADTPLRGGMQISLTRAQPLRVMVDGKSLDVLTAKATIGDALSQAGIPLQGFDYSIPPAGDLLPASRSVQVVRVEQTFELTQQGLPFASSYQEDPAGRLDTRTTITPGQYGVEVSRLDVRYENGQEVSRDQSVAWIAREPQDQVLGYGTQPEIQSIDTPSGPLEYWRAVNVYATSYSPCRSGVEGKCFNGTASGLPVTQGVIAVSRAWYSWMKGQRVYVPGYGVATIGDTGGGIDGKYWIDLAYTDDTYQPWHSNVTMYFLTPVPASFPFILP